MTEASKDMQPSAAPVLLADYKATHFRYEATDHVACVTLDRPERKNPLTFESYAEMRDLFRRLLHAADIKAVVLTGAGGNFCSGGDVHEIIGPLTKLDMPGLLAFTRMTGDLVKAMRACPQPIIASGRADLCAIARPHLADPAWTLHEAAKQGFTEIEWPKQYLSGKEQLERNLARAQLMLQV